MDAGHFDVDAGGFGFVDADGFVLVAARGFVFDANWYVLVYADGFNLVDDSGFILVDDSGFVLVDDDRYIFVDIDRFVLANADGFILDGMFVFVGGRRELIGVVVQFRVVGGCVRQDALVRRVSMGSPRSSSGGRRASTGKGCPRGRRKVNMQREKTRGSDNEP